MTETVDPLGGSYYVEALTDRLEHAAHELIRHVDELGGAARAIAFFQDEIHRSAYAHQRAVEAGDIGVVGVNVLPSDEAAPRMDTPAFAELEVAQCRRLQEHRARRDATRVDASLHAIANGAAGTDNLLPAIIDAVKAGATLGEISDVLRRAWGVFRGVAALS